MKKPLQLSSAEAVKRRSDIQAVLASYMGRNSTVTELIKNIPELAGSTQPRELFVSYYMNQLILTNS